MPEKIPTDMGDVSAAAIRDLLLRTAENEAASRSRRFRRRFALWGGCGLALVGLASFAGAAIVGSSEADDYAIVHCLSSSQRGANGEYSGSQAAMEPNLSAEATAKDALRICTEMWAQGVLSGEQDPLSATAGEGTVPKNLELCVMPDGRPAVVPGKAEVCRALGLDSLVE